MKVMVAGSGTMGMGIAQVFAQSGWDVVVYGVRIKSVDRGVDNLNKSLGRLVEKGKIDEAKKNEIMGRIVKSDQLESGKDCDLIVEAIIENVEVKKEFFGALDEICKEDCIFTSNTSSISITEISSAVKRKDKFAGIHFFNPAAVMKLIEVIRGYHTSDETFNKIVSISKEIGKEPVEVKESPGFVVNKILIPMINEAICVLEQGIASAEDIDKAMCLGASHPMGPLSLADLIGNDVVLNIMDTLYTETGDGKYRASVYLRKMVRAGKLGKKSGSGFFNYAK